MRGLSAFRDRLQADKRALRQGLYGPCLCMSELGVRVGEALALRWEDVDLERGLVYIHGTKAEGSERALQATPLLRSHLLSIRPSEAPCGIVWGTSRGRAKDVSNFCRALRTQLDESNMSWASSHTFRKTVATRMDEAGYTAREIADQLGHARPSMTQDYYMHRGDGPDLSRLSA